CNTAAGESDRPGAESLSGLARAVFYAGARALLVSHWAVNSQATVQLITGAFKVAAPRGGGRAGTPPHMLPTLIRSADHNTPLPPCGAPCVGRGKARGRKPDSSACRRGGVGRERRSRRRGRGEPRTGAPPVRTVP